MNKPTYREHPLGGFTLIEVISVMVIMVLVMTIAVGSHLMWKRHNALDAVEMQVLAHLSLARQHAITQVRPTTLTASNSVDRGFFAVSVASNPSVDPEEALGTPAKDRTPIGSDIRMPTRVLWLKPNSASPEWERLPVKEPTNDSTLRLTFLPDGSCVHPAARGAFPDLSFAQAFTENAAADATLRRTIRVNLLTGMARALTREARKRETPP